jgi:hypothetical protein
MRRLGEPLRRTPMRRRRVITGPSAKVRQLVLARAGERCEVCGVDLPVLYSIHHRRPRRMGGTRRPDTNQPQNLMAVCGSGVTGCHGRIESDRAWAVTRGYLLPDTADPATVPVRLTRAVVLLCADGTYTSERTNT